MMLDASRPVVQVFGALDKALYTAPTICTGNFPTASIGDRIAFGRHNSGHGEWGDMSAEAAFYGLATAIVFYNQ